MRPGQLRPNELEVAILERLARKEPSLGGLDHLRVLSREFTGVGSFTRFKCKVYTAAAVDQQVSLDTLINVPGVPNGLGAVLFCKGGAPACLEVFTYGDDHWDGLYDGFSIEETG